MNFASVNKRDLAFYYTVLPEFSQDRIRENSVRFRLFFRHIFRIIYSYEIADSREEETMKIRQADGREGMNRDGIKMIAMVAMTLNHIADVFLEPGTFFYEFLTDIGYFTAITMCYFLVEGYSYTRSRKKYAGRLLCFGLLSQLPYQLAFSEHGLTDMTNLNMMFTLLFCFGIIYARKEIMLQTVSQRILVVSVLATAFCDWFIFAAVFTLLFLWAEGSKERTKKAFLFAIFFFGLFQFMERVGTYSLKISLLMAVGSMLGPGLSGVCLLYFYNGKKAERGTRFLKWFFYLYYPVHLLVLGLIRMCG